MTFASALSNDATAPAVAMDGIGLIGTLGFFLPAALVVAAVTVAVVRDRRLEAREARAQDAGAERSVN